MFTDLNQFHTWFAHRAQEQHHHVTRVPLQDLHGWTTHPETGDLHHHTGGFFTIQGLDLTRSGRGVEAWQQPIMVQPEQGVLGILVKEFNGVPHCLLQAKMEPGNVNGLQLSPTVQATQSNIAKIHGGRSVPYLQYFTAPRKGLVLSDVLQSEQASWFLAKRNRNMIVRVDEHVPILDEFCWLSFPQISALLRLPNLMNMDTRTVLAGAAGISLSDGDTTEDTFRGALTRSRRAEESLHSMVEVLSWFTEAKGRCTLTRHTIPLNKVSGWSHRDGAIKHDLDLHFSVIGVAVQSNSREVTGWHQPMFEPRGQGIIAFLVKNIRGVLHLLVQARIETGALDGVEMAPTVQCQPENYKWLPEARRPLFLDEVLAAPEDRVRFDSVHSEEGGRFYHARNRYLMVEVEDDFDLDVPQDYTWVTLRQLTELVRYGNHLNVEARSLLTFFGFYEEA
ncbi:NDP-hexose 2,3-dehydratase family protein [Nocardiopsis sp. L17-MgMaSL7]|uniref:NDP-hexose 2,3-dehydratase family protein n=1 Tax=Nocardiopsis sp. L17-MgMaSL7 TaxID=1938893 RepID=UPI000D714CA5|nr:NDP-hexose 2,3-dehydratase family protein [Nocardiopsis sp. L17-MgMaSL7]PWV57377.1 oxidase EvaA [Nocardiopsis sp. L17-MgMaSL7]